VAAPSDFLRDLGLRGMRRTGAKIVALSAAS
jgi:hypothetical protein